MAQIIAFDLTLRHSMLLKCVTKIFPKNWPTISLATLNEFKHFPRFSLEKYTILKTPRFGANGWPVIDWRA